MNLYFLVEGKTERIIYPKWLEILLPNYSRINNAYDVQNNHYYLISGGGYPSLLDNHLADSIAEVDDCGCYDYLVLCLDCDDKSPQQAVEEVENFIKQKGLVINSPCQLKIIPQHKTIETWCLANSKIYPRHNQSSDFQEFAQFYNVMLDDPENMLKPKNYLGTIADYHFRYLSTMLREQNVSYTKSNPIVVTASTYIQQLQKRINETEHLLTMREFFNFCRFITG